MSDLLHILQHAMGFDRFGRGTGYRNHFVTGEGSDDHPTCMEAVATGLMVRRAGNTLTGNMDLFLVTDAGRQYIRTHSPKVDARQRRRDRYSRFLDLSDAWPDYTFRQFLRDIQNESVTA